jgi:hypothetical protein
VNIKRSAEEDLFSSGFELVSEGPDALALGKHNSSDDVIVQARIGPPIFLTTSSAPVSPDVLTPTSLPPVHSTGRIGSSNNDIKPVVDAVRPASSLLVVPSTWEAPDLPRVLKPSRSFPGTSRDKTSPGTCVLRIGEYAYYIG